MLARDLQSIVLYDQEGKFVGVRRPSSKLPIDIDGTKIVIVDAIGSSGLDLKVMTRNYSWTKQYGILFDCLILFVLELNMVSSLRLTPGCQLFMLDLVL